MISNDSLKTSDSECLVDLNNNTIDTISPSHKTSNDTTITHHTTVNDNKIQDGVQDDSAYESILFVDAATNNAKPDGHQNSLLYENTRGVHINEA